MATAVVHTLVNLLEQKHLKILTVTVMLSVFLLVVMVS